MGGYEAVIEEIEQRGNDAIEVGEKTQKVKLAEPAGDIPAALPGSVESARESASLQEHWQQVLHDLSTRVTSYGDGMVAAAQRYAENEEAAAENLRLHIPEVGGPL